MQTDDLVVRLGATRSQLDPSGPQPENAVLSANDWGPDKATFELARTPDIPWADLAPRTAVEIEIGGIRVWKGRIRATPATPDKIAVECEGLQYALDDNPFQRLYVHNAIEQWQDWRTYPSADLTKYTTGFDVGTGPVVRIANTAVTGAFPKGGVYMDFGAAGAAKRIVVTWAKNQWAGTGNAYFFASDTVTDLNNATGATSIVDLASVSTSGTFTASPNARYLLIFCDTNTAQASDRYFRVDAIKTFGDTAWESGNVSVLKSSQVVADAILQGKGWTDTSRIATTTDAHLALDALTYRTARDVINTVNQYENYIAKVDADGLMSYQAPATTPSIYVTPGYQLTDGSLNSVEGVYDEVVVMGMQGGKVPVVETRTQTGTVFDQISGEGQRFVLEVSGGSITSAFAQTIGDQFLEQHRYSPFKGTVTVAADQHTQGAGGEPLHASRLLRETGAVVEIKDQIDPTKGTVGRKARLASVTYRHATRTADLDLDASRQDFEKFLARYMSPMVPPGGFGGIPGWVVI